MTTGQDGHGPEQLAPVWETLPLPGQPDPGSQRGVGSGSHPVGPGQQWEPYSPPSSVEPGEVVHEPPLAPVPSRRRRPIAALVTVPLAVVLLLGVGGVVVARSISAHSPAAGIAEAPGMTAPDPALPAPDPELGQFDGTPLPGVVAVYGQLFSTTGLVMDTDGTVVVPYHPLTNAVSAQINVVAPGGPAMDATMVGFDVTRDIAVLNVPGLRGAEVPQVAARPIRDGDTVDVSRYAIGRFGAGIDYSSTVATEVLDTRAPTAVELVWTEFFAEVDGLLKLRLNPAGDGGVGQVVFVSGEVAGLVIDQDGSSGYAVPIADLTETVSIVRSGADSGPVRAGPPGSLGLTVGRNSADIEDWPTVTTVEPFGPAAAAGIKEGDLLITVGDVSLNADEQPTLSPAAVLRMLKPDSPVEVTWKSRASGQQQTATVIPTTATGY